MFGFKALNQQNSSSEDESTNGHQETSEVKSVEAIEAKNMSIHKNALGYLKNNDYLQSQQSFLELLNSPMIQQITPASKTSVLSSTMAMLKYSSLKNLATIYETLNKKDLALKYYVEAIDLDGREVSVWYHIGVLSIQLEKWNIARMALEKAAIQMSPNKQQQHWLSLEKLIELLFVLGDFDSCENLIRNKVFAMEPGHLKGNILLLLIARDQYQQLILSNFPVTSEQTYQNTQRDSEFRKLIGNNETTKAYIQSLIKQREKLLLKSIPSSNSNTPPLNNNNNTEIPKSTYDFDPSLNDFNSTIQFLKTIYKERSKNSEYLYKHFKINTVNTPKMQVDIQEEQQPQQPIELPQQQQATEKDVVIVDDQDQQKPQPQQQQPPQSSEIHSPQLIQQPVPQQDVVMEDLTTGTAVTGNALLNSSTGSVNTSVVTPAPTTRSSTLASRRTTMETRSKSSKSTSTNSSDEKLSEFDEYLDRFISVNRPISVDVMSHLQGSGGGGGSSPSSLSTNSNSANRNGKKNGQSAQSPIIESLNSIKEKKSVEEFLELESQKAIDLTIIDWIIEFLNFMCCNVEFQLQPSTIKKLFQLNKIINRHQNFYFNYYLFFAEFHFDRYQTNKQSVKEQKQKEYYSKNKKQGTKRTLAQATSDSEVDPDQDNQQQSSSLFPPKIENMEPFQNSDDLSSLSYYYQMLIMNQSKFPKDSVKFNIRFKWLQSRYTKKVMGDINLASVYLKETEELLDTYNQIDNNNINNNNQQEEEDKNRKSVILYNCKHDRIINSIVLEEIISQLQDQQQKNTVGQLFNSKRFDQVVTLLEPIFPDSLCTLELSNINNALSPNSSSNKILTTPPSQPQYQFEFITKEHMDSQVKSRLNMIDLLLQSYLNLSNYYGVLKMTIILLKEISPYVNQPEIMQKYFLLLHTLFKHDNMKPRQLDEQQSTLLSIIIRILMKFYKKLVSFESLSLFIDIYQFDISKQLNLSQKMSLYLILHNDLSKKRMCNIEVPFLYKHIEMIFKFLMNNDKLECEIFDVQSFIDTKEDMLIVNLVTDISQCFNCLYGIKLMTTIDDHHSKLKMQLQYPSEYMQLFMLIKLLSGDEEDISLPMNPMINRNVTEVLEQVANRREFRDLLEKIYVKFQEPPERVTKYKVMINQYLAGLVPEIVLLSETSSPVRIDYSLFFSRDETIDLYDPIFDDIYTDIYYFYAIHLDKGEKQQALFRELLVKDLYCNPNRSDTWQLLEKSYSEEYTNIVNLTGTTVNVEHPEIEQKIEIVYQKLKAIYKHLAKIEPNPETHYRLALLSYERHYFVPVDGNKLYKSQLMSLYRETLGHVQRAINYCSDFEEENSSDLWKFLLLKGKVERKLGELPAVYLETLGKSVGMIGDYQQLSKEKKKNFPIYPIYRLHCDRLKLLIHPSSSKNQQQLSSTLNNEFLEILEKFNFEDPQKSTVPISIDQPQSTTKDTDIDIESLDDKDTSNITPIGIDNNVEEQVQQEEQQISKDQSMESSVKEPLTLEQRRDALIENSVAALQYCRQILYYHHQSAYRITWAMRFGMNRDDAKSSSLSEFIKLMKPKLSRLSKNCIWSLWNEDYLADGKLDRYFVKYYKFFIQLLKENNDIKNLEIVYFKLKSDPTLVKLASRCYIACCRALSNLIKLKSTSTAIQTQQQLIPPSTSPTSTQSQVNELSSSSGSTDTSQLPSLASSSGSVATTTTVTPTTTTVNNNSTNEVETLLKYIWELNNDTHLFPEHKSIITSVMVESYIFFNQSPSKVQPSIDNVVSSFEKKFAKIDKRKKNPATPKPVDDSSIVVSTPTIVTNTTDQNVNTPISSQRPTISATTTSSPSSSTEKTIKQPLKKFKSDNDKEI
ncbi:hypothetical protein DLAC_00054 [Tieghemostelium lacteum]|uniref:Uncharacterized protein n=1 Tax=Tieghemostelium lacteum TaxID=361077 RepID=A0A152A965_TIELA|nr:hypothetical protein DLAC_00054 [Tieghemostelium lacteum]|eukprot:KYR02607.1 hypothetical protein DLAC_00054 [Tieghemostelium lacteum]